ncbi:GTPase ObgE [Mahella australiensis]|uniref:GTPase Obg n=1 Tax=Mahella australiensis (strain DSM 15567 / CIP 107919 / 50-1 BON) TaxID=697281 RepID=F3ZYF8_MAHA5|nr:GTPase ObgE [Mahella australiensis]AEE96700.1 GTP-binding protein Obg/CgtA [Mahella australiensis 50-1 BON]
MFVDRAKIYVKSGDGGNGAISFRREKYVPRGGPDGGDGGDGGNVILQADQNMNTLMDFKYKVHYKAQRGQHGQGSNMRGRNGEDLIIKVPVGTVVIDAESSMIIGDLINDGQQIIVAYGGKGGKGNAHFTTSVRQTPRFAQEGEPGQERWVILELKMIADVGLIGFPNAGKSTILSIMTAARPKIADYPFTTLSPNLGVAYAPDGRSFVLADIPGLIEGAHEGTGLGYEFLRHVERTRLLLHVVDASGMAGRDPVDDFYKINEELRLYNEELAKRPQIILANKMDLPEAQQNFERIKEAADKCGYKIFAVSAAKGQGFEQVLYEVLKMLDSLPKHEGFVSEQAEVVYVPKQELNYNIKKDDESYIVEGSLIDKLLRMTNIDDPDSLAYFQKVLEDNGVFKALKAQGARNGCTVKIGAIEFDYIE